MPQEIMSSPLESVHLDAGATFTNFAAWKMPLRYTSELAEHSAVRECAGLFDLSHMAEITLIGTEAGASLDYALSGKISALAVGQAKYSLLLNIDGGILDDLVVYRLDEDIFLLVANAANRQIVVRELQERIQGYDCVLNDDTEKYALIALQGPGAEEILRQVGGFMIPELDHLGYYRITVGIFENQEVLVARTGYTGEDGFEFFILADAAAKLWAKISEAGNALGILPCGLAARDTLRLEAGMPLYGQELTPKVTPIQVGLARVVASNKKMDFVGAEALAQKNHQTAQVLVGLRAQGRRAARSGYPIFSEPDGGEKVGEITSGALSPSLGYPIAMALISTELATVGGTVFVDVRGTRLAAQITSLPFYTRKKK